MDGFKRWEGGSMKLYARDHVELCKNNQVGTGHAVRHIGVGLEEGRERRSVDNNPDRIIRTAVAAKQLRFGCTLHPAYVEP